ncbi:hypothetical protein CF319_g9009 [Tilletia indica]|nr:hypothetical protein CF319_g9009 [Tilletia indica]
MPRMCSGTPPLIALSSVITTQRKETRPGMTRRESNRLGPHFDPFPHIGTRGPWTYAHGQETKLQETSSLRQASASTYIHNIHRQGTNTRKQLTHIQTTQSHSRTKSIHTLRNHIFHSHPHAHISPSSPLVSCLLALSIAFSRPPLCAFLFLLLCVNVCEELSLL